MNELVAGKENGKERLTKMPGLFSCRKIEYELRRRKYPGGITRG
jgi:hypothetical protein